MTTTPVNELMQELLTEVTGISSSVAAETDNGREIVDSLSTLANTITSSLGLLRYLKEQQQTELLETYADLKNTIVKQIALLGEIITHESGKTQEALKKIPQSQMDAAIAGAYLTSMWTPREASAEEISGRNWVTMFVFLVNAFNSNVTHSLDELKNEMIVKGVTSEFAQAMTDILVRRGVIIRNRKQYMLDTNNETFIRAWEVINSGALPLL